MINQFIVGEELKLKIFFNLRKYIKILKLLDWKNYRSTQNILSVASKLIENNKNRVEKIYLQIKRWGTCNIRLF